MNDSGSKALARNGERIKPCLLRKLCAAPCPFFRFTLAKYISFLCRYLPPSSFTSKSSHIGTVFSRENEIMCWVRRSCTKTHKFELNTKIDYVVNVGLVQSARIV